MNTLSDHPSRDLTVSACGGIPQTRAGDSKAAPRLTRWSGDPDLGWVPPRYRRRSGAVSVSGADYRQAQELQEQEMWECVYCGRPVPQGTQSEMHLCCGEVGHVGLETESGNQMAQPVGVAGKD